MKHLTTIGKLSIFANETMNSDSMKYRRHFTVSQLSLRWQISGQTIRQWIRRGDLNAIRLGKKYLIPHHEVERIEAASAA